MSWPARWLLVLGFIACMGGCASTQVRPSDDPDLAAQKQRDPWERLNRSVFSFNDALDAALVKPAAMAYSDVVPDAFKFVISNFFNNLADAYTSVNNLLQGKLGDGVSDLARFGINTTFGLFGLGDVASELGLQRHREDFGQTLGRWGVGDGPYVVLPFFGPSTLRDALALPLDLLADPLSGLRNPWVETSARVVRVIDRRASFFEFERVVNEVAIERYSFFRDGYLQRRRNEVYDGDPPEPDDE